MRVDQMRTCLDDLLGATLKSGAEAADARVAVHSSMSAEMRGGEIDGLEHEQTHSVSLRALVGKRQAHVSGSDLSRSGLQSLVERVCAMAAAVPEDPWCGLPSAEELETEPVELGLGGGPPPVFSELADRARRAEAAALAVAGVTKVDQVTAGWENSRVCFAATNGFRGELEEGASSIAAVAIAGDGNRMERDYEVREERMPALMPAPEEIGRLAGERAVRRLGPRKMRSGNVPVIFDRRLSASLLQAFVSAIAGPAIARGVSFLKDSLGERVFAPGIRIVDDPLRLGGHGSRPFDGEGRPVRRHVLVEDGMLAQWILSGPSARQLGLEPNGFASLGFGDPPGVSVSNLEMEAGSATVEALMREANEGLIVTDMFGPSINPNTGDYSVGVSGFRFERGEPTHPVNEVTVAGDLPGMFARMVPGSVLERRESVNAPDLLVDGMRLGGAGA